MRLFEERREKERGEEKFEKDKVKREGKGKLEGKKNLVFFCGLFWFLKVGNFCFRGRRAPAAVAVSATGGRRGRTEADEKMTGWSPTQVVHGEDVFDSFV